MATNFPGSTDSFTNPSSSTLMDAAAGLQHDVQHTNANDAIAAIEAFLLGLAYNSTGITLRAAATQDGIRFRGRAGGTSSYYAELVPAVLSAIRSLTVQDKDGTIAMRGTGTVDGVFDWSSRIAVTGAVTATINRVHEVVFASAATITLPAAASVAGQSLVIQVGSTNTATVTVDGNGAELIDGAASLTMHKNGLLWIYSDGTGWRSIIKNRAPGIYVEASDASGQVLTSGVTNIQYNTETFDTHNAWNGTTFTAPVDGVYAFHSGIWITAAAAPLYSPYVNGTIANFSGQPAASSDRHSTDGQVYLTAGQTLSWRINTNNTRTAGASGNTLAIKGLIE